MRFISAFATLFACICCIHGLNVSTVIPKNSYACGLLFAGPLVQKVTPTFQYVDGLFWDAEYDSLLFVDRTGSSYSRYFPNTGLTFTIPVHNLEGKQSSSIFPAQNAPRMLVLAADRGLYLINETDMEKTEFVTAKPIMEVFSDQKSVVSYAETDDKAKILMGDKLAGRSEPGSSRVVRVDVPARNVTTIDKFTQSSGIAFTQDYKNVYVIDIFEDSIYRYDYDSETGQATNRRVVFNMTEHRSMMSGRITSVVVDTDGKLWIGCLKFNGIVKFNMVTNKIEQIVTIPATVTNSLAFGGYNSNVLFVGTTKEFPVQNPEQEPDAGAVFAISGTGSRGWLKSRVKI